MSSCQAYGLVFLDSSLHLSSLDKCWSNRRRRGHSLNAPRRITRVLTHFSEDAGSLHACFGAHSRVWCRQARYVLGSRPRTRCYRESRPDAILLRWRVSSRAGKRANDDDRSRDEPRTVCTTSMLMITLKFPSSRRFPPGGSRQGVRHRPQRPEGEGTVPHSRRESSFFPV